MYNNISPKYKSFLFFIVKLSIIVGSLYFIYDKIVNNNQLTAHLFLTQIKNSLFKNQYTIVLLSLLTIVNWFFEIWKWKVLASIVKKISFIEATKQSLAALTVSLLTPNRIGDYGAKAIYFPKNKWKIMLLNLIGNLNQLTVTTLFGVIGLVFFITTYSIEFDLHKIRRIGYLIAFLILIPFSNKKIIGFFKFDSIWRFVKKMTLQKHVSIFLFSLIRYLVFSYQFYFLLTVFEVETNYFELMHLIFSMYLVASFIPSMSLFDWAVKGSVAIYIFSFVPVSELTIVTVTLLMWILNFAIPALIGSGFVLTFKYSKK